jgi:hypothetical protein
MLTGISTGMMRRGNRLFRDNRVATAPLATGRDWLYAYDTSHRLDIGSLGQLNTAQTSLTSTTLSQDWGLDALGNWGTYTQKASGSATLNQTRSHNTANEISTIGIASGGTRTDWIDPTYDLAGNRVTGPYPLSPNLSRR